MEENTIKHHNTQAEHSGKLPRMASFKERLGAWIIDYLIIMVVQFMLIPIFLPTYFYDISRSLNNPGSAAASYSSGGQVVLGLITLVLFFAYFGYFYTTRGQTLGKMALKIKVVRSADLKYLGWGEAILREVIRAFLSGLLFFLGYLWYFMSEKRQTWHDMVASSYVVKTDDAGNILMDGLPAYKKEPIKTFGCCGAMGLVFVGLVALFVYGAVLLAQGITEGINNGSIERDFDYEMQNEFNYEYDEEMMPNDGNPFGSEEEMRRYFEENFPEEMEQLDQMNQENPQTAPNSL